MTNAELGKLIDKVFDKIDDIEKILTGDGTTERPGLCERVRNIEKDKKKARSLPGRILIILNIVYLAIITFLTIKLQAGG